MYEDNVYKEININKKGRDMDYNFVEDMRIAIMPICTIINVIIAIIICCTYKMQFTGILMLFKIIGITIQIICLILAGIIFIANSRANVELFYKKQYKIPGMDLDLYDVCMVNRLKFNIFYLIRPVRITDYILDVENNTGVFKLNEPIKPSDIIDDYNKYYIDINNIRYYIKTLEGCVGCTEIVYNKSDKILYKSDDGKEILTSYNMCTLR